MRIYKTHLIVERNGHTRFKCNQDDSYRVSQRGSKLLGEVTCIKCLKAMGAKFPRFTNIEVKALTLLPNHVKSLKSHIDEEKNRRAITFEL